jgi:hypothetical protein
MSSTLFRDETGRAPDAGSIASVTFFLISSSRYEFVIEYNNSCNRRQNCESNHMPLRDFFQSLSTLLKWEALHGGWPMMIAQRLNSLLPPEYISQPSVRVGGGAMEIDIAAFERESVRVIRASRRMSQARRSHHGHLQSQIFCSIPNSQNLLSMKSTSTARMNSDWWPQSNS